MNIKIQFEKTPLIINDESFNFHELTTLQKLDAVLDTLELYSKPINDIQRILRLKLEPATLYEVRIILNKLLKDDYAEEIKSKLPQPVLHDIINPDGGYAFSYKITFEGLYLKSSGGYQGLENQKNAENIRLEKIEKKAIVNQRILTWLTILVCVGTLAQATYALVKLYWEHGWFR